MKLKTLFIISLTLLTITTLFSCEYLVLMRDDIAAGSLREKGDIVKCKPNGASWGKHELNESLFTVVRTTCTGSGTDYSCPLLDDTTVTMCSKYALYVDSITSEMTCEVFEQSLKTKE